MRHVVRRFVAETPKTQPEPWDYRGALPGVIQAQLAPQYWIWQAGGFDAKSALQWFNGVVEALIDWQAGHNKDGFNLTEIVEKIEQLVPQTPDGDAKTAMIAIYFLWHEWTDPKDHRPEAKAFLDAHLSCLDSPSPIAYTVDLLSNHGPKAWTPDQWADMAASRRAARVMGKEAPLPPAVDALIQLEAADQLEAVGRHDKAVVFAANAVEESPGHEDLLAWEGRLLSRGPRPELPLSEVPVRQERRGTRRARGRRERRLTRSPRPDRFSLDTIDQFGCADDHLGS